MKIANSAVSMTSSHVLESHVSEEKSSVTLTVNDNALRESFAPMRPRTDVVQLSAPDWKRTSGTRTANAVQISVAESQRRTEVFQSETRERKARRALDELPQLTRADAFAFDPGDAFKEDNLLFAHRQKHSGTGWSTTGSGALAQIATRSINGKLGDCVLSNDLSAISNRSA